MFRKTALISVAAAALLAAGAPASAQEMTLGDAVKAGDKYAVETLLAARADPNALLADTSTPLAWAVAHQNPQIVKMLLAGGAHPDMHDQDGVTPLLIGCQLSDPAIVEMLLDAKADVAPMRADRISVLEVCAKTMTPAIVEKIIALGGQVNHADANGQTPLMWAAAGGKLDNIATLLKHGAEPNAKTTKGFTPLLFAIKGGSLAATEAILAAGGELNHMSADGTTAIMLATYQKNFPIAAMLAQRGAELNHWDQNGHQPLHVAAINNQVDLAKVLIAMGAKIEAVTIPPKPNWQTEPNAGRAPIPKFVGMTPLLVAAQNGHVDMMKTLTAAGAKKDFVGDDGTNVLLAAAVGGSTAALDYAIELQPDLKVQNDTGATVTHLVLSNRIAQVRGYLSPETPQMIRLLASKGAPLDIRDNRGRPPNPRRSDPEVVAAFEEAMKARGLTLAVREGG